MAIWEKLFSKITFKDYPDTSTPLNANNLNKMTDAIDGIDDRVVELNSNLDSLDTDKQEKITGGASTITGSNLTASRVLVSNANGKVAVSAVTATELDYLDGVTSKVQTQIDNINTKLKTSTSSGITKKDDIVILNLSKVLATIPNANTWTTLQTLATAYRPKSLVRVPLVGIAGSSILGYGCAEIGTDGVIKYSFSTSRTDPTELVIFASYPSAN